MFKVLSEAAIDQRVRRACTKGVKKRASGGPQAVELFKDVNNREALAKMLIDAGFSKALILLVRVSYK